MVTEKSTVEQLDKKQLARSHEMTEKLSKLNKNNNINVCFMQLKSVLKRTFSLILLFYFSFVCRVSCFSVCKMFSCVIFSEQMLKASEEKVLNIS